MQIVKCSASAINLYRHCPFAYFMQYILHMETRAGKSALQGQIVHRTLEWMAKLRKRGKINIDPMWLLDRAWDKLTKQFPEIEIRKATTRIDPTTGDFKEAADYKKCRIALETVLADTCYNPYNLKTIDVEQQFTIVMPGEDWQCIDDTSEIHQFTIRGLIDLVHEIDSDTLEIIDWKTGKKTDFYTQQSIDDDKLMREVQPRLYHLAAYILYPQYKNILITFYYLNDGGPLTIALSHDDIAMTIAALRRLFITIRNDTLIRRNRSWTCRMCSFGRSKICDKVWTDLHMFGNEYIKEKYTNLDVEKQLALGV